MLHISKSATQKIIEELNVLHISKSHTLKEIEEMLTKNKIQIDNNVLQEIADAIIQTNPFLVTTSEKGHLSTDYKRNLYFKEKFYLIQPTEYL